MLDAVAVARLRNIMRSEGVDEAAFLQRDTPAPLRWFRQAYPELNIDQATRLGLAFAEQARLCLLYTSPSPRDRTRSRMPSSA